MCAVSYIGEYWTNTFPQRWPDFPYQPMPSVPIAIINPVTQEQFEQLRKEVAELKELLLAAKKFDEATDQPHCEQDKKVEYIRYIAKLVGVDLKDVFPD